MDDRKKRWFIKPKVIMCCLKDVLCVVSEYQDENELDEFNQDEENKPKDLVIKEGWKK